MGCRFTLTDYGNDLEGWRHLPRMYATALVVMGILFGCVFYLVAAAILFWAARYIANDWEE